MGEANHVPRRLRHAGGRGHTTSVFLPRAAPGEFVRADGDCVCAHCGRAYVDHPFDPYEIAWYGDPWLHVLCDGTRVKL